MTADLPRRTVIGGGLAVALAGPAFAAAAAGPHGLIGRMRAAPGQRTALAVILREGTGTMPGCLAYLVNEDTIDADALWITEVWVDKAAHDASLSLPQVRDAIRRGRPLIAGFDLSLTATG